MASQSKLREIPLRILQWIAVGGTCTMEVSTSELLVGSTVLLATAAAVWFWHKQKGLPPGPWGIPFFGVAGQFHLPLHLESMRLREKYNSDVISFKLKGQLYVVLHGHDLIKEIFATRGGEFCDRPEMPLRIAGFKDDLLTARYSEEYKINKKFAAGAVRSACFGIGMSLENKVLFECKQLVERLHEQNSKPTLLEPLIRPVLVKVITSIVYDANYSKNDPEVDYIVELLVQMRATCFSDDFLTACTLPSCIQNIFFKDTLTAASEASKRLTDFMMKKVSEHRSSLNKNKPRDLMDIYLIARDGPGVSEDRLVHTLWTFIFDAIDAVCAVLIIGLYHLSMNKRLQDEIKKELDENIGTEENIKMSHRPSLNNLQAIILECFRVSNIFPMGTEHSPVDSSTIQGYHLPKRCCILANFYSVHMDASIFPEAETFRPEHFLNEDGDIINSEYMVSFSLGRRMCLGEQIVKAELFLILGSLLREFHFSLPQDAGCHKLDPWHKATNKEMTKTIEICAHPR